MQLLPMKTTEKVLILWFGRGTLVLGLSACKKRWWRVEIL
jgi:hypothetical protein